MSILLGIFLSILKYTGNLTSSSGFKICFSKQKHSIFFKYFAARLGDTLGIACPTKSISVLIKKDLDLFSSKINQQQ